MPIQRAKNNARLFVFLQSLSDSMFSHHRWTRYQTERTKVTGTSVFRVFELPISFE